MTWYARQLWLLPARVPTSSHYCLNQDQSLRAHRQPKSVTAHNLPPLTQNLRRQSGYDCGCLRIDNTEGYTWNNFFFLFSKNECVGLNQSSDNSFKSWMPIIHCNLHFSLLQEVTVVKYKVECIIVTIYTLNSKKYILHKGFWGSQINIFERRYYHFVYIYMRYSNNNLFMFSVVLNYTTSRFTELVAKTKLSVILKCSLNCIWKPEKWYT